MKMLKCMIVLGVLLFSLAWCGCEVTPGERVQKLERMATQAEKVSDKLGARLAEMEAILAETQAVLTDPNLPIEFREQFNDILAETIEGIKVVSAERGKYAELISKLHRQIEEAGTDTIDFGDELKLYGEGLRTTAKYLPPPVSGFVTLAGVIFGVIGTALAKKRGGVLVSVVRSVDKLLESSAVPDVGAAMQVLKNHQLSDVRAAIKKAKRRDI